MNIDTKTRTADHMELGQAGEDYASRWLSVRGYRILARNWRSEKGELDIIAIQDRVLVGIEVKTRRGLSTGHPFESISPQRLRRLQRTLLNWMHSTRHVRLPFRIDLIAVVVPTVGAPQVDLLQDVLA